MARTCFLEEGALEVVLTGSEKEFSVSYAFVLLREDNANLLDLATREDRGEFLEDLTEVKRVSLTGLPVL
jgi:hypothetical protein